MNIARLVFFSTSGAKKSGCFMKKIKLLVGSGAKNADLRYASGFNAPDSFICYLDGDETGIIVSVLEYARAQKEAKAGVNVYLLNDYLPDRPLSTTEVIKKIAALHQADTFVVPDDFPLWLADRLRLTGLEVEVQGGCFFPERAIKTATEIDLIRAANAAACAGCRRAFEVIGASGVDDKGNLIFEGEFLTSERLRSEIDVTMMRHNAFSDGTTITSSGLQSAEPHNIGSGIIQAHTPIVMDIFPRHQNGYWGDLTRTVVKGKAPDVVKRAFAAVKEARDCSKDLVRVEAIPADLDANARAVLERHGFKSGSENGKHYGFIHSLGHGVGLDIHENPRISVNNHNPLQGSEVITIEPGIYYPEWGGIRLEDLVIVRPDGCETLTDLPTELEIQ